MVIRDDQALIDRYLDLTSSGPAVARVRGAGMHVWAIVDALRLTDDNVARVAAEYEIPIDAVVAVQAHYQRHKRLIDAYILIHAA